MKKEDLTMEQTRLVSFIEACINTFSGFFISLAVWIFVVIPLFDIDVTYAGNLAITSIFTVSSLLRSFIIRRWFNNSAKSGAVAIAARLKRIFT